MPGQSPPSAAKSSGMKIPKRLKIYESPIHLLLLIAATLFVTHTLAMVVFALLPQFSMWTESLIESVLLLMLLFPVLYFFSLRPLLMHIAEREQAEEAMRESESKYRNLFEHLSDATFLVDVETGRILDTNSQGERLLGRTRGEIMGMNQSKLYSPDKENEQRERFAAYGRQERPESYESEITRKDGGRVPVRISGVPTILHGRKLILEFIRDITAPGGVQEQR
jgi:PAS domain S-box-containing protein